MRKVSVVILILLILIVPVYLTAETGGWNFSTHGIEEYLQILEDVINNREHTVSLEHNLVIIQRDWNWNTRIPNTEWSGDFEAMHLIRNGRIIGLDRNSYDAFQVAARLLKPDQNAEDTYRISIINYQFHDHQIAILLRNDFWFHSFAAALGINKGEYIITDVPDFVNTHP
ncbi:hypothetical protein [Spirochaeta dissipatitropha]